MNVLLIVPYQYLINQHDKHTITDKQVTGIMSEKQFLLADDAKC